MSYRRSYRLIEASLVALMFIEAARIVFANLLSLTQFAIQYGQVELNLVNGYVLLVAAAALSWFAPRRRQMLPVALHVSAILVAVARIVLAVPNPVVSLYAGFAVFGIGAFYFALLLRANWCSWTAAWPIALCLDQLLRAYDAYDFSVRAFLRLPVDGVTYAVPWLTFQIAFSLVLILFSRLARRTAAAEPYEPAFLSVWGGISFGGFLLLEMIVLAMPNVVARWTGVPYSAVVGWLILATALPLLPGARMLLADIRDLFEERLRGWAWVMALITLIVVGNRLDGYLSAGALIVAQFIAVYLLWWIPDTPDPEDIEQVGPSISLGLITYTVLITAYSFAFLEIPALGWLNGQSLIVILVAAALLGMSNIIWGIDDQWVLEPVMLRGVPVAFASTVFVFGLVISVVGSERAALPPANTIRVATYNMNGAYDASGVYQMELVARTIEASLADVVVLQEVDTGRPLSYGMDQVYYLSRRLGLAQAYLPTNEQVRGVAILSRWPLVDVTSVMYPGSNTNAGALSAVVADPTSSRRLTVLGTQLSALDDEQRLDQLITLLGLAGDAPMVILAADLGAPPQDAVYQHLVVNSGFVDPDHELGIENSFTTPAVVPVVRHDYVLIRGLVPLDSRQVDSSASDHRLVVVEVGWPFE
ncbi:MAG: endonuclease/exonuclease/phosphatase family protein [Anaerolineae bacterium]|nr:endonuclease/exonuclease/phosphatase family protein [Anaerolineae bacterium]